ncbi:MAG: MMPL family transporter [Syntrophobacteraceae bacterium]
MSSARPVFFARTVVRFILRVHRAILLGSLCLTLISVALIGRLRIDTSLDSLLPSKEAQTRLLLDDLRDAGVQDVLIALISLPRAEQFEDAKAIVDGLVAPMAAFPSMGAIEASLSGRQRAFFTDVLLPHAALYLSEADRSTLLERLSDTGIEAQVKENKRFLLMPMQGGAGQLILRDPLNLRAMWLSRWLGEQSFGNLRIVDGYLADDDRRHLLVFMHPRESARNLEYTRALMAAARGAADEALQKFREAHPDERDVPSIAFAGGYPIALEDEALTRKDLQVSLLVSLIGVNLLFYLVFRSGRVLLLVLVPLGMAVAWTFGFMGAVLGHVSVLTGAFGGVLLGLSTDFAIYFLNFYLDVYGRKDCESALLDAMGKSGGIVTGGVTSAAGFLTLGFASFRGFSELGIFTGVGLLMALGSMLLVLPAFLVWDDRRRGALRSVRPVSGFGLERVFGAALKRPRGVLAGSALVLVLLGGLAFRVSFDDDLRSLRPKQSEQAAAQQKVETILGGAGAALQLTMEDPSEEALLNRASRMNEALDRLQAAGRIAHYRSVLSYLPAPDAQRQVVEFLRDHSGELDPDRVESSFRRALKENGFQWLPEYESYLRWMRSLVNPGGRMDRETFERAGLGAMLERFLVRTDAGFKLFTTLHPVRSLWAKGDLEGLMKDLGQSASAVGLDPKQWRLGGFPVLSHHLKEHVWDDLGRTVALAGASVAALVVVALGGVVPALLAAVPLAVALLGMLGGMSLLSMPLNFANFVVLPMMIGICINDGALIMTMRLKEPGLDLATVLNKIGRAVLLTSLTTLMGFGSLVSSHYPGLQSIGWLSLIGIGSELSASLVLLPALLAWMEKRKSWNPPILESMSGPSA